jgi:hypothetical protein
VRRAKLPDEARRVPGGAAGQLLALEKDDVFPAELDEVIGNAAADDPSPNDDYLGSRGNLLRLRHTCSPEMNGGSRLVAW